MIELRAVVVGLCFLLKVACSVASSTMMVDGIDGSSSFD